MFVVEVGYDGLDCTRLHVFAGNRTLVNSSHNHPGLNFTLDRIRAAIGADLERDPPRNRRGRGPR